MKKSRKSAAAQKIGSQGSLNILPEEKVLEIIREKAQRLYEARGAAPGREMEDWLEAERQVKEELHRV